MATKTRPSETTIRRLRALVHTEDAPAYQVAGDDLEALRRAAVELGEGCGAGGPGVGHGGLMRPCG